jgi:hypothetical protein
MCRRSMEISWNDGVRNEVLQRVKGERNILCTMKKKRTNWIGHILHRNCPLKHVIEGKIEGKIEVMGRRGRRCKQLLDDFKEVREYWKLEEEALDPILENSLWKRLWTCCKTDYRTNGIQASKRMQKRSS